jgi:hypothetical protein
MSPPVTTARLVVINTKSATKEDVIRELVDCLVAEARVTDRETFVSEVLAREAVMATGIHGGIGIPHAHSESVTTPSVAVATSTAGIPFGAPDGPAHLIFLIAGPSGADNSHLQILAAIARKVVHDDFRNALIAATEPAFIAEIIDNEVQV